MVRMHSDVKKFKWKQYYFEEKFHGIIDKVEKILEGSLDLILLPSPSVKIQIMAGILCLRCKGKTWLGVVNKVRKTKSLLTSPYYLKWIFPPIIFTEGDGIKSRLSS